MHRGALRFSSAYVDERFTTFRDGLHSKKHLAARWVSIIRNMMLNWRAVTGPLHTAGCALAAD
jgi:hypothetical protein